MNINFVPLTPPNPALSLQSGAGHVSSSAATASSIAMIDGLTDISLDDTASHPLTAPAPPSELPSKLVQKSATPPNQLATPSQMMAVPPMTSFNQSERRVDLGSPLQLSASGASSQATPIDSQSREPTPVGVAVPLTSSTRTSVLLTPEAFTSPGVR